VVQQTRMRIDSSTVQHGALYLQWVLLDGEIRHVSDFAHITPRQRPAVVCPVCDGRVTMKLGSERVHHCAHRPGDACAATQPETILHLNTKFHLYHQIRQSFQVVIREACTGQYCCGNFRDAVWLQGWDKVEVEYSVGSRRPDIAVLFNHRVSGAIEVRVTHAVDPAKAQYLAEMRIPWAEVIGTEALYSGDSAWTATQPLPIVRRHPEAKWHCPDCERRFLEAAIEAEHRRSNYTHIYCWRLVDFYYPSNKKYRDTYVVMERVVDGQPMELWLTRDDGEILAKTVAPLTREASAQLNAAFSRDLERRRHSAVVDNPMSWVRGAPPGGCQIMHTGNERFPPRYYWSAKNQRWFIPEWMRETRWQ
jgi:hypothetical protein